MTPFASHLRDWAEQTRVRFAAHELVAIAQAPTDSPATSAPVIAAVKVQALPKENIMTVETTVVTGIDDVLAFIEKAAPAVQGELAALAKTALTDAKSAFTPVADAAVIAAVALITSKFALNAPFSATEIAFLQGVIAKLSTLIPTPAA